MKGGAGVRRLLDILMSFTLAPSNNLWCTLRTGLANHDLCVKLGMLPIFHGPELRIVAKDEHFHLI